MSGVKIQLLRLRRFFDNMFQVEGSGLVIGLTGLVISLLLLRIVIFLMIGW